jgi:uncharacterized membrane protein YkvA (DUF1232 family)
MQEFASEEAAVEAMIDEGGPVEPGRTAAERAVRRWPARPERRTSGSDPEKTGFSAWLLRKVERISEKLGVQYLELLGRRGRVSDTLRRVPRRMRKVVNQTELVLELIDDFRDGTYREVPWHSVAIASAGLLYSVSPADVIPEFIPLLGSLDDLALMAVATRAIEKELRAYCRFKGYAESDYF